MFYDLSKQLFDFRTFKTIRSLGDDICNKRVTIGQSDLFDYLFDFNSKIKPKLKQDKKRKNDVFDSVKNLYRRRELVINVFIRELFPFNSTSETGVKILTSK